jgi:HK97 gp10 family phage protein
MASANRKFTLEGSAKLIAKLRNLQKQSTAKKVLRRAVNIGTTPILQAIRAMVPVAEGDLRRAMAKKVGGYGFGIWGIVGADAGYVGQDGKALSKEEKEKIVKVDGHGSKFEGDDVKRPSKYDHLVEFGHRELNGGQVPPHPFMRPGWDSSIAEAQEKFQAALADGIEKEAAKG